MSHICLLTLCGLPAAGKTTFAQSFASFLVHQQEVDTGCCKELDAQTEQVLYRVLLVVYDDLLPAVLSTSKPDMLVSDWKEHRRSISRCLDQLLARLLLINGLDSDCTENVQSTAQVQRVMNDFARLTQRLDEVDATGRRIIILLDDNMYYASMRYEIYQLARKYSVGYVQVYFPMNLQRAIERNRERVCRVPDEVIVSMANRIDVPSCTNAWERRTAVWTDEDHEHPNFYKIIELMDEAMKSPVVSSADDSQTLESRVICSTNVIHQSDCMLRQLVAEHINGIKAKSTDTVLLRQHAQRANTIRQTLLKDMKNHSLLVPQSVADSVANRSRDADDDTSTSDSNCLYDFVKHEFSQKLLET